MKGKDIIGYIDHTLLRADARWLEIKELCEEAVQYKAASVCIPPSYVKRVRDMFSEGLIICTVAGFPLGYIPPEVKRREVEKAVADGADEVDMVINIGDVKNGDLLAVESEIREIKETIGSRILKVIVETCYLTEAEKINVCHAVAAGGADYIKTSTGFGTDGATIQDIVLFREHLPSKVKIKAAGGIRTVEDMVAFIEAGCARIGSSAGIGLLRDRLDEEFEMSK